MKFFPIVFSLFAAGALSKNGETPKSQLRLPDGPTCKSVGKGANGLEQFEDPDGCCLLPIRCGNEAGERCERVGDSPDNGASGASNGGFDFSQGSNGGPNGPLAGPPCGGKRNGRAHHDFRVHDRIQDLLQRVSTKSFPILQWWNLLSHDMTREAKDEEADDRRIHDGPYGPGGGSPHKTKGRGAHVGGPDHGENQYDSTNDGSPSRAFLQACKQVARLPLQHCQTGQGETGLG
ncbi:hypothetical protein PG996_008043 [Apiospora saccharicola]|uniref:Uncharacterized protein n=1 Tax=Apiospora saccharicola TaxID=335842 RepID=A0ABR1UWS8_9PEZI